MTRPGPAQVFRDFLGEHPPRSLGVAVSGGSDSVAMLRLAVDWARDQETSLVCYTVDHGLREGSAQDANFVADLCESLGVPCQVLTWQRWDGQGNKSAAARNARYDLMAEAARADGVDQIALAHTQDDQAETVLMRLTRKAGVDGLAAMSACRRDRGILWLRPLMGISRSALREYLKGLGQDWREDPSNEDPDYDRIRLRQQAGALAALGLTAEALATVAQNMQQVQAALDAQVMAATALCQTHCGAVRIERHGFLTLPAEIQRRLLAGAIGWVAPGPYGPRRDALAEALAAVAEGRSMTLAGCLVLAKPGCFWVTREAAAVAELAAPPGSHWDRRWQVETQEPAQDLVIRALGETGVSLVPNWRDLGLPRQVLAATPAVWREERLIAAPLLGYGPGWQAFLAGDAEDFQKALVKR